MERRETQPRGGGPPTVAVTWHDVGIFRSPCALDMVVYSTLITIIARLSSRSPTSERARVSISRALPAKPVNLSSRSSGDFLCIFPGDYPSSADYGDRDPALSRTGGNRGTPPSTPQANGQRKTFKSRLLAVDKHYTKFVDCKRSLSCMSCGHCIARVPAPEKPRFWRSP